MGMLAIRVPAEIAGLLARVPVPEKREAPTDYHITLFSLGDAMDLEEVSKGMIAGYPIVSETKPFTVSTSLVTSFDKNPGGVPVIAKIESPELHALREKLAEAFDSAGVEYSKKFPEFRPHCTLSYAEETPEDLTIPTISWTVDEITLFAGDKGESDVIVKLPLNMALNKAASLRVAARFQRSAGVRVAMKFKKRPYHSNG